ncbi:MAG: hypothetical protein JXQ93_02865 [Flavobacteriaceae bacterium]
MIKFFRKIRYKLMSENRTGKYLKYAIGEIILVVIGILIALQINNWNETNKLKAEEQDILKSLVEEIKNNNQILKRTIGANKYINKVSFKILDSIDMGFTNFERQNILITTAHNPKSFDIPVLMNILNNQNSLINKKKTLISKLRTQRFLFENTKKDLYYVDENWNAHLSAFSINCGFDFRTDTKNGQKISLAQLKKCGYNRGTLKALISMTCELRATWIQNMELSLKHSKSLLKELNSSNL